MNLKDWRIKAGLNQQQASAKAGIFNTEWSRYETGRRKPSAETLALIHRLTDGAVSLGDFYDVTSPLPAPKPAARPATRTKRAPRRAPQE